MDSGTPNCILHSEKAFFKNFFVKNQILIPKDYDSDKLVPTSYTALKLC